MEEMHFFIGTMKVFTVRSHNYILQGLRVAQVGAVVILKNENLASQQGANCSSNKSKTYLEKAFHSILKSPPCENVQDKSPLNKKKVFF